MDTINNNKNNILTNATLIAVALFTFTSAHAAPSLNQVASGTATVTQNTNNTTINQTTNNATIDWNSFNTTQNQTVLFNQPTTQSLTINNILDANPSQIHGSITANGRIVLLNPNGFFFGTNSSVSAHTFIAAATSNSNTTYNSLTNTLSIINNASINGTITNNGTITATKTQLIAKRVVTNETATINTTNNTITITATQDATLHGTLTATNSNIDIFSNGTIRGSANTNSTNTTLTAAGELSLSGTHTATNNLTLTASPLFLESTAILNANTLTINSPNAFALISATTNAHTQTYTANTSLTFIGANLNSNSGTITIGNQTTPTITINPTTTITNNATGTTNAGDIIIFSKDNTSFYGTASATAEQGNGGLIELSSTGTITHSTPLNISTTSTHGTTGTLLIDPTNIIIVDPSTFSSFDTFKALFEVSANPVNPVNPVNPWTELVDPTNSPSLNGSSEFARAIALSETYALIGAWREDYPGNRLDSGNAYLYNLSTNTWTSLRATTGAPSAESNDGFAWSVALNDTYALIGSRGLSDDYLYKLDGTNAFTANCATTGTLTSAWCGLSSTPEYPSSSGFGSSVALNDTYALVGSWLSGGDRGDAHLYKLDGTNAFTANCATTGTLTSPWCSLSTSTGQPISSLSSDSFLGNSVALNDTYALIGAYGSSSYQGDAFLYKLDGTNAFTANCATTGTLTSPWCNISPPSGGAFGNSVSLNDTHALIGAPGVSSSQGKAYLYAISDGTLTDLTTTTGAPAPQSGASFGGSVALSSTHALIGASGYDYSGNTNSGNAYLYNLNGGTDAWTGTDGLLSVAGAPIKAYSGFGGPVALTSTHALMGVHLYDLSSITTDINALQADAQFGYSVALTSTHALIGAHRYNHAANTNSGNAFLYNLSTSTWTNLRATTDSPALHSDSQFGTSVALNDTYALIGAYKVSSDRGDAYLYKLDGTNSFTSTCATTGTLTSAWCTLSASTDQPITTLNSGSGFGISVALNDTYALVGAWYASQRGDAYLYKLDGTNSFTSTCATTGTLDSPWCSLSASTGNPITDLAIGSQSDVGNSVALSDTYALIGARRVASSQGNAYLFNLNTKAWTDLAATTDNPITALASNSLFGDSVALNDTYALIGAQDSSSTRGNAYLFNLTTNAWTDLATTTGQPITALSSNSWVGDAVALNDTYALIGAPGVGTAYLYNLNGGANAWTSLIATAGAPAPQSGTNFGWSVALSSTHALIGANTYDYTDNGTTTNDSGNAYLYNLNGGANAWADLIDISVNPLPPLPLPVQQGANFGSSVALTDTHALIGAHAYDYTPSGGTASNNSGNAFLYDLSTNTWINLLATTDAPSIQAGAQFGISVALNETYALIGSHATSSFRGDAYLYKLDGTNSFTSNCATTGTLTSAWCTLSSSAGQPITSLFSSSFFGIAVALNDTHALIGAWGVSNFRGDAFLYKLDGTNSFTSSCATTGSLTSPWCRLSSSTGQPITALFLNSFSFFGTSVALNDTYALIGATRVVSSRGNAFLYKLDGTNSFTSNCATTGTLTSPWCTLSASTGQPITALTSLSYFGASVALNDTYALIGAGGVLSTRGNAYLFNLTTSTWTDLSTTTGQPITALASNSRFGESVSLNDTYALIGAQGVSSFRGDAYLYKLDGTNSFDANCAPIGNLTSPWCTLSSMTVAQPIITLASSSNFGQSVALNSTHALIGASGYYYSSTIKSGNAFLYSINTGLWSDLLDSLSNPPPPRQPAHIPNVLQERALFGISVALSSTHALIGAPLYDYSLFAANSGNAFLYNLSNNTWTNLLATTGAPAPQTNAHFGDSVALSSTHALIGARLYDYHSSTLSTGNAFLYNLSDGGWTDLLDVTENPPAPQAGARFGDFVALTTSHALIGAPFYDYSNTPDSGTAFLYNLGGGTDAWTNLLDTTGAPAPQANAQFGASVALSSTHALIGAPQYDYVISEATEDNPPIAGTPAITAINPGNAYLYNLNGGTDAWTGTDGLLSVAGAPAAQPYAGFGNEVAITETHALIGADLYDYSSTTNSGNAFLYNISDATWTGTSTMMNGENRSNGLLSVATSPEPQANAHFGDSVALNATHALIGADRHTFSSTPISGKAFLYELADADGDGASNEWTDLIATTGAPAPQVVAFFGFSVALSSTHALIGAPFYDYSSTNNSGNAFLFNLSDRGWTDLLDVASNPPAPEPSLPLQLGADKQGYSVALNATHALIGTYNYDYQDTTSSGTAFLYNLADESWVNLLGTTGAPTIQAGASFGYAVALSSTYALIGSHRHDANGSANGSNHGNAYLYTLDGANSFTSSCATSGTLTSSWCTLSASTGQPITTLAANSYFGYSVALNDTHALIGAFGASSNQGNAYLYDLSGGTSPWTTLLSTDNAPTLGAADGFGVSVALNNNYALIGSYLSSSFRGNAYLYDLNGGTDAWTNLLSDTSNAPTLANLALFGFSVDLSATHALIGAFFGNNGNAYLYDLAGGTNPWTDLRATDNAPSQTTFFGYSVALSSTHALIGEPIVAKAHLYNISSGTWNSLFANNRAPGGASTGQISVALSSTHALIGSHTNDSGNAYLFSFLPNTGVAYDAIVEPNTFPALLENNNVTFTATNSITVYSSIDLSSYTGTNTLTLSAPTVAFFLSNRDSVVGSANNSVIVTTPSGNWNSTNLTLPANGTTYLATPNQGILNSIGGPMQGSISLTQTVGDITLNNNITVLNLTLSIMVPNGTFTLGNNNTITVSGLTISDENTEDDSEE